VVTAKLEIGRGAVPSVAAAFFLLTHIAVLAAALSVASSAHAQQRHRLDCPREAPAEWGLAKPAPLEQPAVLSQPNGEAIDESAPPSLVPDRMYARGSVWHNVWLMGDEPGWSHFVDCQYRGSKRVLRLKANGLKQCEQTATPYSPKGGVAHDAAQTMVCD
jgi:hypothetical protein